MRLHRFLSIFLVLVVTLTSISPAVAGWLSDAYTAAGAGGNITPAGSYQTEGARGWSGGSMTWRVPNRPTPLVQANAPSLNMGCGGIDWYAGSFQFVNLDKFVDTLRNMGQQAVGYFFSLALKTMAPEVSQTLDYIADQVNKINQMSIGGCKQSQMLVDSMVGKYLEENKRTSIFDQRDTGKATDNVEAEMKAANMTVPEILVDAESQCKKPTGNYSPLCEDANGANYLYWAVTLELGPNLRPGLFASPNLELKNVAELTLNLFGSWSRDANGNVTYVGGTLTFADLVGSTDSTYDWHICKTGDDLCLSMEAAGTQDSNTKLVHGAMAAIYNGVQTKSAPVLTSFQQRMITASRYPIYRAAQLSIDFHDPLATMVAADTTYEIIKDYGATVLKGLNRMKPKLTKASVENIEKLEALIKFRLENYAFQYAQFQKKVGTPIEAIKNIEIVERGMHQKLGNAVIANARFRK